MRDGQDFVALAMCVCTRPYMDTAQLPSRSSCDASTRYWLQSYIRPCGASRSLRALMEFAKNVLISVACTKHKAVFRFAFSRSDLSRHHLWINPSNQSVDQLAIAFAQAGRTLT